MNAAFRQNLSVVFTFDGNNSGIARDTRGSLGDVTDRARFCRTTATPIPGVSDPHGSRPGTGFGGWQRGSLTPQMPPLTAADSRAHCDAGGTERRPVQRSEVAHRKEHRGINAPRNHVDQATRLATNSSPGRGNTAPASVFPLLCGTFIRKLRILDRVEFIEAPTFTAMVAGYLEDDEYRALQLFLAGDPEAGDVMPGTGGFRKLRWADRRRGKGKRGGLRVIYYHLSADAQIWLMTLYDKDEMADLSAAEKRALKAALEAELARRAARRRLRRK